jgi:hypothetical protein
VWDLKTGSRRDSKYEEQLKLYGQLLEKAGYKVIGAKLFYIDLLQEVSLTLRF